VGVRAADDAVSTARPRGAHVQFETNGLLFMAVGILLLTVPNRVGRKALWVMVASAWLTWLMVLSEVANSWWGTSQMLPIAPKQAGAMGAAPWQELIVKLCHIPAALGLILSFVLLIMAFVKCQPIKFKNSPRVR
jgi:hydroxylaminobenzene mutase